MTSGFLEFVSLVKPRGKNRKYEEVFIVDCANGVGAITLRNVLDQIQDKIDPTLINIQVTKPQKLNVKCGPAYVQDEKMEPFEYQESMPDKVACISGDGDRLIYFKRSNTKIPTIIDGDKIFGFLMMYIVTLLEAIDL